MYSDDICIENIVFRKGRLMGRETQKESEYTLIVNTTEIAKMAGVSVPTVSNWKRRSSTFPEPAGIKDGKPAFDYDQVTSWLKDNGKSFSNIRNRNLVWEYSNRIRTNLEPVEAAVQLLCLLHLRKAADEYNLHAGWKAIVGGIGREVWLSYLATVATVEHESGRQLSNHVIGYARHMVEGGRFDAVVDTIDMVDRFEMIDAESLVNLVIDSMGSPRHSDFWDNDSPLQCLMAAMANEYAKIPTGQEPTFYNPACGSAYIAMQVALSNPRYRFALADLNAASAVVAQARYFLQFGRNAAETVVQNNLIAGDPFPDLKCCLAVATPLMGLSASADTDMSDPRWKYHAPKAGTSELAFPSELAFLQDCASHLDKNGKAFVAVRPAMASRREFKELRRRMVTDSLVEAVVSLPRRQLRSTGIPIDIWVLSKGGKTDQVHLIDCTAIAEDRASQGLPDYLSKPLTMCANGGCYRWSDIKATDILADENVSLAPTKWVRPKGMDPQAIGVASRGEIAEIRDGMARVEDASNPLRDLPDSLSGMTGSRTFTIRELVDKGEAVLVRGNTRVSRENQEYREDVITPANLSEGLESLPKSENLGKREHVTEAGDVVFCLSGPTEAAVDTVGSHRMSHAISALRMKDDAWIPEFIALCMQAKWNQAGSTRNVAAQIEPLGMELPVVDLDLQRKLVDIRNAANELKRLSDAAGNYAATFCNAIRFGAEQ